VLFAFEQEDSLTRLDRLVGAARAADHSGAFQHRQNLPAATSRMASDSSARRESERLPARTLRRRRT
jgi:hypothetical protein